MGGGSLLLTSSQNALIALCDLPSVRSLLHVSYALRSVSRSLPAVAKRALALSHIWSNGSPSDTTQFAYCEASSRLSIGLRNKGFDDKDAAMVSTGPRHWKIHPKTSI
jgi:hypothetical protein